MPLTGTPYGGAMGEAKLFSELMCVCLSGDDHGDELSCDAKGRCKRGIDRTH